MGHYDECRPGYCAGCGQASGVIWNCGNRYCSTYQLWLKGQSPAQYSELMQQLRAEREAAEEQRVTQRQIQRNTRTVADAAKKEAEN